MASRESGQDTAVPGRGCTESPAAGAGLGKSQSAVSQEGPPVVGWRTSKGLKMGRMRNDLSSH